jgi:hydroxymethylpyrimidine/phosphomethylpyrimidine kinase
MQVDRTTRRVALTIAGSDPSGGAGLQADLKTFHQHGVYGTSVVTLLTVQSTQSVLRVEVLSPELVAQQLGHLLADITVHAVKTGALGSAAVIEVVAAQAGHFTVPLVVDPVMVSKHGHPLLDPSGCHALITSLLPHTFLLTPNTHEAEALLGRSVRSVADAHEAARRIAGLGPKHVLVKGGHLEGPEAIDVLFSQGATHEFRGPRINSPHTHGTGCTLSAAITANLALGHSLPAAIAEARSWLTLAIVTAPAIGQGVGPLNHFAPPARAQP